ncbi:hypothetical protein JJQ72_02330 [Paenibacillus sp. F411]|uniref:hypothetical protein n=1 Tax=Paenibacillus sp. F411 TaxID=2820239 RepID=UPI001AAE4D95|nr:hypothetical protein [Paenibacillus sp. F411]MBO2942822.1 hypothetical protein [Paenibacillus sp. F411]
MAIVTRIDVSLDLNQPVREIADVISLIINSHPGQQLAILKQVDEEIGAALAKLEREAVKDDQDAAGLDKNSES